MSAAHGWREAKTALCCAFVQKFRGGVVTLREVNSYELVGAEDYIARQFKIIEEAMNC